jgi:hypothetical protein
MNKRILELAEQANLKLDDLPDDTFIPLKKFSELIVKECIQVLNPDDIFEIFTRKMAQDTIKQHFGVEE